MSQLSIFSPNTQGVQQLQSALAQVGSRVLDDVWRVLRAWGQEYQRRIKRVIPVDTGMLRNHIEMRSERNRQAMTVIVGTSFAGPNDEQYVLYLEFGTATIAGGRVKSWMPGEPPIMEWPAKMHDIPNFRISKNTPIYRRGAGGSLYYSHTEKAAGRVGSKKFERSVGIAQSAFTAGEGEQMPFFRPIGIDIAPHVVAALTHAVQEGLGGLDARSF